MPPKTLARSQQIDEILIIAIQKQQIAAIPIIYVV